MTSQRWLPKASECSYHCCVRTSSFQLAFENEAVTCLAHGIEFRALPVPDLGAPIDSSEFMQAVQMLAALLRGGTSVAVHCRQSVGRSGLLAVAIAVAVGVPLESAIREVSAARGVRVPETTVQTDWLRRNVVQLSELAG